MADELPPSQCRKSRKSVALTYPEPLGPPRPFAGLPLSLPYKIFHNDSVAASKKTLKFTLHKSILASTKVSNITPVKTVRQDAEKSFNFATSHHVLHSRVQDSFCLFRPLPKLRIDFFIPVTSHPKQKKLYRAERDNFKPPPPPPQ